VTREEFLDLLPRLRCAPIGRGRSVHTAGNGARLYDGHWPSPSEVEGWHAPVGRRTCEPRPLDQAGQIRLAAPVGARKTWGPADRSISRQPERRRPIRRSGRDPGPRPYAHTTAKPRKQGRGRKHYPHPPCRIGRGRNRARERCGCVTNRLVLGTPGGPGVRCPARGRRSTSRPSRTAGNRASRMTAVTSGWIWAWGPPGTSARTAGIYRNAVSPAIHKLLGILREGDIFRAGSSDAETK